MRELTTYELDTQLAEQLPARELMGAWKPHNKCGCDGGDQTGTGGEGGAIVASPQINAQVNVVGDNNNTQTQDASGGDVFLFDD